MIISQNLCGIAVAFPDPPDRDPDEPVKGSAGRYQGSRYGYQKRQIANATEWIRLNAVHKPMIFVCTTSWNWGSDIYHPKIETFTNNLRNGYNCKNYLWVREFTGSGLPHYHFIADLPFIRDPVGLSRYWSRLFGYNSPNCVRLGSKPGPDGKRRYYVNSRKMAFYLAKYLSKDRGDEKRKIFPGSWMSATVPGRTFGISHTAGQLSQPIQFKATYHFVESSGQVMLASGKYIDAPAHCIGRTFENEIGEYFNPKKYSWKKMQEHNVWIGKIH